MSHSEPLGQRARQAVAQELRATIARRQVTLTVVSRDAGIPRSTLHRKLHGQGDLTVSELVRLAIALEVPATDLVQAAVTAAGAAGS